MVEVVYLLLLMLKLLYHLVFLPFLRNLLVFFLLHIIFLHNLLILVKQKSYPYILIPIVYF